MEMAESTAMIMSEYTDSEDMVAMVLLIQNMKTFTCNVSKYSRNHKKKTFRLCTVNYDNVMKI